MKDDAPTIRGGLRVLIVEDELLIAMDLEQLLANFGCTVVGPAPTVAAALDLLERERPDSAILDVNLGRARSTPVAEALLARGVPFALSTGYEGVHLPEEALRQAPRLGKPLDAGLLRAFLSELGGPKAQG